MKMYTANIQIQFVSLNSQRTLNTKLCRFNIPRVTRYCTETPQTVYSRAPYRTARVL